jgi:hypothetical protein
VTYCVEIFFLTPYITCLGCCEFSFFIIEIFLYPICYWVSENVQEKEKYLCITMHASLGQFVFTYFYNITTTPPLKKPLNYNSNKAIIQLLKTAIKLYSVTFKHTYDYHSRPRMRLHTWYVYKIQQLN